MKEKEQIVSTEKGLKKRKEKQQRQHKKKYNKLKDKNIQVLLNLSPTSMYPLLAVPGEIVNKNNQSNSKNRTSHKLNSNLKDNLLVEG